MNLIPYSRYARTVLNCEKTPFLHEFLDEPDTPLDIRVAPGCETNIAGQEESERVLKYMPKC